MPTYKFFHLPLPNQHNVLEREKKNLFDFSQKITAFLLQKISFATDFFINRK